jgi:hypothetical protein
MARIWQSGAEPNDPGELLEGKPFGDAVVDSSRVRTGSLSVKFPSAASGSRYSPLLGDNLAAEKYVRMYFYATAYPTFSTGVRLLGGAGTTSGQALFVHTDGYLSIRSGSASTTPLATSTVQLPLNEWVCLELLVVADQAATTSTRPLQARMNGQMIIDTTGSVLGMLGFGTPGTSFGPSQAWGSDTWGDDFAWNDPTGPTNNSWVGLGGVVNLLPDGDSSPLNWSSTASAHWTQIADLPPDTTTYIFTTSKVDGNEDRWTLANTPSAIDAGDVITAILGGVRGGGTATQTRIARLRAIHALTGSDSHAIDGPLTDWNLNGYKTIYPSVAVEAQPDIPHSAWSGSSGLQIGNGTYSGVGQEWTPGADLELLGLFIRASRTGTPTDNLVVSIRSGSFSGTVLASGEIPAGAATFPATATFYSIPVGFTTPIEVSGGTKYYLVVERSGSESSSHFCSIGASTSDVYANHDRAYRESSTGAWTTQSTVDHQIAPLRAITKAFTDALEFSAVEANTNSNEIRWTSVWASVDFYTPAASGPTASLNLTLDSASVSSAGTVEVSGSLVGSLDNAALSGSTTVEIAASLARSLDDATLASSVNVASDEITASLDSTLGDAALSGTASVEVSASTNSVLGDASVASAASVEVGAAAVATLGETVLASAASVEVSASASPALDDAALVGSTSIEVSASTASILGDAALVGSIGVEVGASLSSAADDATLSAAGKVDIAAAVVATLDDVALSSSGSVGYAGINGALVATLDTAALSADAGVAVAGSVTTSLDSLSGNVAAAVTVTGAANVALDDAVVAGTAAVEISASLASSLEGAALAAAADIEIGASLAQALGEVAGAVAGTVDISAAATQTLQPASIISEADVEVLASAANNLGDASVSSDATVYSQLKVSEIWLKGISTTYGSPISLNVTLDDAELVSAGTVSVSGETAATLDAAISSTTATVSLSGTLSATLDPAAVSASAGIGADAHLASQLAELTGAGAGSVLVSASTEASLEAAVGQASATAPVQGAVQATLQDATVQAEAVVVGSALAALNATLQDVTVQAEAVVVSAILGAVDVALQDATVQAEATVVSSALGAVDVTLADTQVESQATVNVVAEAFVALGDMIAGSGGTVSVSAHAAPTLSDAVVAAAGSVGSHGAVDAVLAGLAASVTVGVGITGHAAQELEGLSGTIAGGPTVAGQLSALLDEAALVATAQLVDFVEATPIAFASRAGSRRLFGAGAGAVGVRGNAAGGETPGESSARPVYGVGGTVLKE